MLRVGKRRAGDTTNVLGEWKSVLTVVNIVYLLIHFRSAEVGISKRRCSIAANKWAMCYTPPRNRALAFLTYPCLADIPTHRCSYILTDIPITDPLEARIRIWTCATKAGKPGGGLCLNASESRLDQHTSTVSS